MINAKKGDVQKLVLRGPDGGTIAENTAAPVDRGKAQWMMFAGRKVPDGGWSRGSYEATYTATNNDRVITERVFRLEMN